MSAASYYLSSWFYVLWIYMGLGIGPGLPMAMPPGPEDPLLARMAPQECLYYTSWAGTATADPKSENRTEQLLADPEVRLFVEQLQMRLRLPELSKLLASLESAPLTGADDHTRQQRAPAAVEELARKIAAMKDQEILQVAIPVGKGGQ